MRYRARPIVLTVIAVGLAVAAPHWRDGPPAAPAVAGGTAGPPSGADGRSVEPPAPSRPFPGAAVARSARFRPPRGPAGRSPSGAAPPAPAADDPAVPAGLAAAPDAWTALPAVGSDPLADAVWLDAINDPTVPPAERAALIAGLSAEGLPDAQHVTDDVVPLIQARLLLIEQIAPNALDATTAAALTQAYDDLSALLPDTPPK